VVIVVLREFCKMLESELLFVDGVLQSSMRANIAANKPPSGRSA